jgi:SAM-dependent methyltransferase
MPVLDFYGSSRPDLFAIERAAMDRPGKVIDALDRHLPDGFVLDVGAGNGFTADRLTGPDRTVVPLEPDPGMIDRAVPLPWVRGDAARLPFADASFDGAYATWAYFFSRNWDPTPGIDELHRVVRSDGPLVIVDNLGDDEFSTFTDREMSADPSFWEARGFMTEAVDTVFEFDDLEQARRLLEFYFGDRGRDEARTTVGYRVGLFRGASKG